jgi:hypothetical protein
VSPQTHDVKFRAKNDLKRRPQETEVWTPETEVTPPTENRKSKLPRIPTAHLMTSSGVNLAHYFLYGGTVIDI